MADVLFTDGDGSCCCGAVSPLDCGCGCRDSDGNVAPNITGNIRLRLTRIVYTGAPDDPGSTCLPFDWTAPAEQCADGACTPTPGWVSPGYPVEQSYTSGGQAFSVRWSGVIVCTIGDPPEQRVQFKIGLGVSLDGGCSGTDLAAPVVVAAFQACDGPTYWESLFGTYELPFANGWTVYFALESGVCP